MGPQEPTKWNIQLDKWFFFDINQAGILFSKKNTWGLIFWFSTFACFFSKIQSHNTDSLVLDPRGRKCCILATSFIFLAISFHALLHFYARQHMISNFYLKWIEFTKNVNFPSLMILFIHRRVKIFESSL